MIARILGNKWKESLKRVQYRSVSRQRLRRIIGAGQAKTQERREGLRPRPEHGSHRKVDASGQRYLEPNTRSEFLRNLEILLPSNQEWILRKDKTKCRIFN